MKFIATKELGRLSKWLRILGFDTEYFTGPQRSSLIIGALRDDRVILTRRVNLISTMGATMIQIKSDFISEQITQVVKELQLTIDENKMFTRCTICNRIVSPIEKEVAKEKVPDYVYQTQESFSVCPLCRRIYWQGTHWGNVQNVLNRIKQ